MVVLAFYTLIVVDVCVVTTTKDMDDTCMLANILHESIPLLMKGLTVDNFTKVICVAAAKVPVVKIWDAELYNRLLIFLTTAIFNATSTSTILWPSKILV